MKPIKLDSDSYSLASKWSDLTSEQILFLAKLYIKDNSFTKLKVVYCLYLMGLRLKYSNPIAIDGERLYYVKHSRKRVYLLGLEQIHAIVSGIEWLFYNEETKDGKVISINPRLIINPVKDIKIRFTTLRGPDDALGNLSFLEFMFAETYLHRYQTTKDSIWLAKFIATLWRPLKRGNVTPFDQLKLEQWAKRTVKVKPEVAQAIIWFYAGCKYFLSQKFKRPFSGGESGKPTDPFEGYMKLTTTLAGADATKSNAVRNANLYDTLGALDAMLEAKENQKSQNNG